MPGFSFPIAGTTAIILVQVPHPYEPPSRDSRGMPVRLILQEQEKEPIARDGRRSLPTGLVRAMQVNAF